MSTNNNDNPNETSPGPSVVTLSLAIMSPLHNSSRTWRSPVHLYRLFNRVPKPDQHSAILCSHLELQQRHLRFYKRPPQQAGSHLQRRRPSQDLIIRNGRQLLSYVGCSVHMCTLAPPPSRWRLTRFCHR